MGFVLIANLIKSTGKNMGYCSNCGCKDCASRRAQVNVELTMKEMALVDLGQTVKAIKSVRDRVGLNLKDAVVLIDKYKHS